MNAREREELWFLVGDGRDGELAIETAAARRRLAGDVKNRGGEHPLYIHAREQEEGRDRGGVGHSPGGQTLTGDLQTAGAGAGSSEGRGEKGRVVQCREGGGFHTCLAPFFSLLFFFR